MPRPYQAVALLALLAACSGTKQYADLPDKNLQVRSSLTGTKAVMGVHRLNANCSADYEGVVDLDRPVIDVGLPPGRTSLLVFEFYSSSFLSGSHSIKKDARLQPRPGYRYEARATYKDSLYSVELFEIDPRGARRELEARRGC